MESKQCTGCGQTKDLSCFSKQRRGKYGVRSKCRECNVKQTQEWIENNRDKHNKNSNKSYWNNRDKRIANRDYEKEREYSRLWRIRNLEYARNYDKWWAKNNPHKNAEKSAKQRMKRREATPPWANQHYIDIIYENCPEGYEVDHVVPINGKNVCGLHIHYNLQYLTPGENRSKNNTL